MTSWDIKQLQNACLRDLHAGTTHRVQGVVEHQTLRSAADLFQRDVEGVGRYPCVQRLQRLFAQRRLTLGAQLSAGSKAEGTLESASARVTNSRSSVAIARPSTLAACRPHVSRRAR